MDAGSTFLAGHPFVTGRRIAAAQLSLASLPHKEWHAAFNAVLSERGIDGCVIWACFGCAGCLWLPLAADGRLRLLRPRQLPARLQCECTLSTRTSC